jgi:hypothetical protein
MKRMLNQKIEEKNLATMLLVLILLLASLLRFGGLASQNLGPDEIKMAETVRPDRGIREVVYIPLVDTPTRGHRLHVAFFLGIVWCRRGGSHICDWKAAAG